MTDDLQSNSYREMWLNKTKFISVNLHALTIAGENDIWKYPVTQRFNILKSYLQLTQLLACFLFGCL